MSDVRYDREFDGIVTTFSYDREGRLVSVEAPAPPGSSWEHDEPKRISA